MTIKTILVDDEKLAIQGLQIRLEKFDDIEIVDTCRNGREAIRKIKNTLRGGEASLLSKRSQESQGHHKDISKLS